MLYTMITSCLDGEDWHIHVCMLLYIIAKGIYEMKCVLRVCSTYCRDSLASQPYFSSGRSERGKIRLGTLTSFPCHEGI